ncbi:MAG: hypothetical protein AAF206_28080, partial [Bacteroidota bacterium]
MKCVKPLMTLFCLICFQAAIGQYSEGFENPTCSSPNLFLDNCIPQWMPVSGAPIVLSPPAANFPAFEGNSYAQLYIIKAKNTCTGLNPDRGAGLVLNYNFIAGETYIIRFALQTNNDFVEHVNVYLTNGLQFNGHPRGGPSCPGGCD